MAHGGVTFRHGGFVDVGMTNTIDVPLSAAIFGYALVPKLIVFALSSNPVPAITTRVPTGPLAGCSEEIIAAVDGDTSLEWQPTQSSVIRNVEQAFICLR
jgi:hypothetical protein